MRYPADATDSFVLHPPRGPRSRRVDLHRRHLYPRKFAGVSWSSCSGASVLSLELLAPSAQHEVESLVVELLSGGFAYAVSRPGDDRARRYFSQRLVGRKK